jgi:hypothetical protein
MGSGDDSVMFTVIALIVSAVIIIAGILIDLGILVAVVGFLFYLPLHIWKAITKRRES